MRQHEELGGAFRSGRKTKAAAEPAQPADTDCSKALQGQTRAPHQHFHAHCPAAAGRGARPRSAARPSAGLPHFAAPSPRYRHLPAGLSEGSAAPPAPSGAPLGPFLTCRAPASAAAGSAVPRHPWPAAAAAAARGSARPPSWRPGLAVGSAPGTTPPRRRGAPAGGQAEREGPKETPKVAVGVF